MARRRYSCFDHVGAEGQAYGHAVAYQGAAPCENEVVAQLLELRRRAELYLRRDGWVAEDEQFYAEQNARLVRDAEEYYHQMYRAEVSSWNLRDQHMAGTLDALIEHLDRQSTNTKVVVWEHNSHVGDARATAMGFRGELNVGQLARQRYGGDAALIGFTTFDGWVTAASDWGAPTQRKRVRPARPDSHEALLHAVGPSPVLGVHGRPSRPRCVEPAPPRTGHRRDLPTGDRAPESLLRGPSGPTVRCGHPYGPHPCPRAPRANRPVGPRGAGRDVPHGVVR